MDSVAVAERPPARPAPAPVRPTRASTPASPTPGLLAAGVTAVPAGAADTARPRVRLGAAPSPEVVSLKGSGAFAPPQAVADYLATDPPGGGEVIVRFPGVAAGTIRVQESGGKYRTPGLQAIEIQHPALDPLRFAKVSPVLAVEIRDSTVMGYVTVLLGGRPVAGKNGLAEVFRHHAEQLGLVGMRNPQTPAIENQLSGGRLTMKADLSFVLGGFLNGKGSFGLTDDTVTFAAHAAAKVGEVADIALDIERKPDGLISGRAEIPVRLKNFAGNFVVTLAGGLVDVIGTFRYATEKLSGEVTLLVTDAQTARTVAYQHLPPEAIDASAREAAGGSAVAAAPTSAGPKPGPRAVAGWGTLDVHYNEWLTGRALVIVDGKGHVTVVGKITPPAKVEFPQTKLDYERKLVGLNIRAGYGLPYVGDVYLFAGVSLFAIARISPLTLSKIEIVGTDSTDPVIFKSFSLSANLNISALAGLRLRAEGGLGVEILEHDIKVGAAVLATAGIRAYIDANPMIGYRELADPTAGRRGEFYIHGEAEIAAQPFLALGGELFVKLETPWWSPVSDHTWTWPLGELIYPLPGEIGFGVDVDYVFGSGKLPTVSPKSVDFNADRFMSDLMDDKVAHGAAEEVKKPGRWNERLQAPPTPPPPPRIKDTKGPGKKKDDKPVKDAAKPWAAGMAALAQLKQRADTQPYAAPELEAGLKRIKSQYGFSVLEAKAAGGFWEIVATRGKDNLKKPLRIKRAVGLGTFVASKSGDKEAGKPKTPQQQLEAATAEAEATMTKPDATLDSVRTALPAIQAHYGLKSLTLLVTQEEVNDYLVVVNAELNPSASRKGRIYKPQPNRPIGALNLERPEGWRRATNIVLLHRMRQDLPPGARVPSTLGTKYARRHLVSFHDIAAHIQMAFPETMLVKQAVLKLTVFQYGKYKPDPTVASVVGKLRKLTLDAYYDVDNLRIGLQQENLGYSTDVDESMIRQFDITLREHIEAFREKWELPGDVADIRLEVSGFSG